MRDILVVVDMQNDFIDGALGTSEAIAITDKVNTAIKTFKGDVIFTRDTHYDNYAETQEGRKLPVSHCIKGSKGWQISSKLTIPEGSLTVDKPSFGSLDLADIILRMNAEEKISSITLIGLCTDICVISNALIIKAALPEVPVKVDASCCAGVTVQSHLNALDAMSMCQIEVINR